MKVGIVISAYNSEKTILNTLNSIIKQTYKDYICIVLDNGSIDNTYKKIIQTVKDDSRFIVYREKYNLGQSRGINKAIKKFKEKPYYLFKVDADDIYNKEHLEVSINVMEKFKNIDILSSLIISKKEHFPNAEEVRIFMDSNTVYNTLKKYNCLNHPTVCFRYSEKIIYNSFFDGLEDYELYSRIGTKDNILLIDYPAVKYESYLKEREVNIKKYSYILQKIRKEK